MRLVDDSSEHQSWGRFPTARHRQIVRCSWLPAQIPAFEAPVLAYGKGRSYGDACLNDGGVLLDMAACDRFIDFDAADGLLTCEAGVTLETVIAVCLPRGWFLPVTPGTKFVTVGGAVANDVHGKNHHRAGTFGCHVRWLELLRSDGSRIVCSPVQHADLFRATIGGLGLTGLITRVQFQLKPVRSSRVLLERRAFASLQQFFALTDASDQEYEYTVAWVDCLSLRREKCRGIFIRGRHHDDGHFEPRPRGVRVDMPVTFPSWTMDRRAIKLFNALYFRAQSRSQEPLLTDLDPFFYPLDAIGHWNRMYGRKGFVQYQFVIPTEAGREPLARIFTEIGASGLGSFLAVLKLFGDVPSPGLLSFPMPGVTLALDFPLHGGRTLALLDNLDELVVAAGGRIYPAKDSRMSPHTFRRSFPMWHELQRLKDPCFSSSLWRRVSNGSNASEMDGSDS